MIKFLNIVFLFFVFAFPLTSRAEFTCGKEMSQALQKQGVETTVANSQAVSSEEYKTQRNAVYEEFKILASHAKGDGLSPEAKDLVVKLAFRHAIGEGYVTKEEYSTLKTLGYYDPVPDSGKGKGKSIKERIGNFFSGLVTLAKNAFSSVKGNVTGKYEMPPAVQKAVNALKDFRKKYDIHAGDGFDLLINDDVKFDTIISGHNDSFRAYLEKEQVQAYEIREDKNHLVLVQYDQSCAIKRIVFTDKSKGTDFSSAVYSYYTTDYCANISQLDSIRDQLPSEQDPNEYHFSCQEQGADYNCRCSSGMPINPWTQSCFATRKEPSVTAMKKFEEYSYGHKAVPGYFFSRATFEKSKVRCQIVASLKSKADQKPIATKGRGRQREAVR